MTLLKMMMMMMMMSCCCWVASKHSHEFVTFVWVICGASLVCSPRLVRLICDTDIRLCYFLLLLVLLRFLVLEYCVCARCVFVR